jgi:hypothetical protein
LKLKRGWEKYRGGRQGRALRCAALRSERMGFTLMGMAGGILMSRSTVSGVSGTTL